MKKKRKNLWWPKRRFRHLGRLFLLMAVDGTGVGCGGGGGRVVVVEVGGREVGGCGRGRCCWSLLLVVVGVMGVMSWQSVVTWLCALSSHPWERYV